MNETPDSLATGKTVLIMKNREKENDVTNFRPITCLLLMWKIFTGIFSDELYVHLENERLLPEEQRRCRRKLRETKEQLLIDKMILRNCKGWMTRLGMTWVDSKKTFDIVPHSWLKKCVMMFGVAENMQEVLGNSMKKWKTELGNSEQ